MQWIFLSPHLDDAALSCGGFIAERVALGDSVEIWTVCAGVPPDGHLPPFANILHQRWGTGREAIAVRQGEDFAACQVLGAAPRHFSFLDCIYRRDPYSGEPLINFNEDLFRPLPDSQDGIVDQLSEELSTNLPTGFQVAVPMTLGNHIDHQLVRQAAQRLNRPLWFYQDYPYTIQQATEPLFNLPLTGPIFNQSISPEGLKIWQSAVAEYRSQISSFWMSVGEMENAIHAYWSTGGGCNLWGNSADFA